MCAFGMYWVIKEDLKKEKEEIELVPEELIEQVDKP